MNASLWLGNDKAPYIATLLVAGLGWTLQRAVTVLTDAPTIAYSCDYKNSRNGKREVVYTLANLSRTRQFKNVSFALVHSASRNTSFFDENAAWIVAEPPAFDSEDADDEAGNTVSMLIPLIQPGWCFELHAIENSTWEPVDLVQKEVADDPTLNEQAASDPKGPDSIQLVKSGFSTWLVGHELQALYALSVIWILLLLVTMRLAPQQERVSN